MLGAGNFDESREETRKRIWIEIGIVVCLAVIPYYAFLLVPLPAPNEIWKDSITRVAMALPICAVVLYIMWRSEMAWPHFGLKQGFDATGVGVFVAALLCGLVLNPLMAAGFNMTWPLSPEAYEQINASFLGPVSVLDWCSLSIALLFSAAAEELAIRGFLTTRLNDLWYRKFLAVLVPAIVFGGYHYYQGFPSALAITIEGVIFGWMMLSTKRLVPLVLAHWISNIYMFSAFPLPGT